MGMPSFLTPNYFWQTRQFLPAIWCPPNHLLASSLLKRWGLFAILELFGTTMGTAQITR